MPTFVHAVEIVRDSASGRERSTIGRHVRLHKQVERPILLLRKDGSRRGVAAHDGLVLEVNRDLHMPTNWKAEDTMASVALIRQLKCIHSADT